MQLVKTIDRRASRLSCERGPAARLTSSQAQAEAFHDVSWLYQRAWWCWWSEGCLLMYLPRWSRVDQKKAAWLLLFTVIDFANVQSGCDDCVGECEVCWLADDTAGL